MKARDMQPQNDRLLALVLIVWMTLAFGSWVGVVFWGAAPEAGVWVWLLMVAAGILWGVLAFVMKFRRGR